jgi:hypothetical protein
MRRIPGSTKNVGGTSSKRSDSKESQKSGKGGDSKPSADDKRKE